MREIESLEQDFQELQKAYERDTRWSKAWEDARAAADGPAGAGA